MPFGDVWKTPAGFTPLAIAILIWYNTKHQPARFGLSGAELQPSGWSSCTILKDEKVINGFFRKNKVLMPVCEELCKKCVVSRNGFVRVVKLEEKRSDVNLAVEMMVDAAQSEVECLVVITGDADQVGTVEAARWRFKKTVIVFNPQNRVSDHLKKAASYYKNIPRDLPAQCQLPETVLLANGRTVHRPVAWARGV